MKTIYKYPLQVKAEFELIEIPDGAVILHVAEQQNAVYIWALVDTDSPTISRRIRIIGTGHDASDADHLSYIGSVLLLNGTFVFHIFDAGKSIQ